MSLIADTSGLLPEENKPSGANHGSDRALSRYKAERLWSFLGLQGRKCATAVTFSLSDPEVWEGVLVTDC